MTATTTLENDLKVFRLSCQSQSYAWGKLGDSSMVARLSKNAIGPHFQVSSNNTPYAELWMGTHPNAPSHLWSDDDSKVSLLSRIQSAPPSSLLTDKLSKQFNNDLPFLFKVLSIQKALSIQAHPSKQLAEQLHAQSPNMYKDANHKPEMAVALTPFEGLCGFRPMEEISLHLSQFECLRQAIGEDVSGEFCKYVQEWGARRRVVAESPLIETPALSEALKDTADDRQALRKVFEALMQCDADTISKLVKSMVGKLMLLPESKQSGTTEELFVRLDSQFPGDVGCFCVLLMNYVHLYPGQAMFLAENEPHAYLSGDCIECMATSDNVVRAGLTPKVKDVDTLLSMLTFNTFTPADIVTSGEQFENSRCTRIYRVPVPEFDILQTHLEANGQDSCRAINGPSVLLCTAGSGQLEADGMKFTLAEGTVYFIGAGVQVKVSSLTGLTAYRAICE